MAINDNRWWLPAVMQHGAATASALCEFCVVNLNVILQYSITFKYVMLIA